MSAGRSNVVRRGRVGHLKPIKSRSIANSKYTKEFWSRRGYIIVTVRYALSPIRKAVSSGWAVEGF